MELSGTVGDAREILANVGGKRGHPGSCALKALPNVKGGARWDELGSLLSAWLLCGAWWPMLLGGNNCGGLDDQFVIARGRFG
jgi:hypothetical protein